MSAPALPADYVRPSGNDGARTWWEKARFSVAVIAIVGTVLLTLGLLRPSTNDLPLSSASPRPNGAMAVAEVLRDQGVEVTEVAFLDEAGPLLDPGDTLVIAYAPFLYDYQLSSILAFDGTVVFLGPTEADLWSIGDLLELEASGTTSGRSASCDIPAAVAAGTAQSLQVLDIDATGNDDAVVCFPSQGRRGAYVQVDHRLGADVRLVADAMMLSNERITDYGHAALALHTLGTSDNVVWYMSSAFDSSTLSQYGRDDLRTGELSNAYSPWMASALIALGVVGVFALVWRGRRMGPLTSEPLPVIVRGSEATRGRGRVYRRARARGRATAALRAGVASRSARRLGLSRTAIPEDVISAIASATGRDGVEIRAALYGPPPSTDREMIDLVATLDAIEREVHRS